MALLFILTSVLSVLTPPVPVASSPTPGGAASQAGRALPVVPMAPPGSPNQERKGATFFPSSRGLASWYPDRPATCDGLPVPSWVKAWAASLTLRCGALVRLSGPAGTITVPIEDRGPESWTGRLFDLSPNAFIAVAGNLWSGVVPVSWGPAA